MVGNPDDLGNENRSSVQYPENPGCNVVHDRGDGNHTLPRGPAPDIVPERIRIRLLHLHGADVQIQYLAQKRFTQIY